MNCEDCSERFGDAVDGTLPPEDRAQVEAHCRDCQSCRDLLRDLLDIHAAAATLDRPTPSPDLWKAIVANVAPPVEMTLPPSRSALWRTNRRGMLAAATLVMALGAAAWFDLGPGWTGRLGTRNDSAADIARSAATELQLAEQHYVNAIASLERLTANKESALDPAVAAEISRSLQSIDRAITDSRAALNAEPDSFVAQTSLLEALRMKVGLLQETVTLMSARS